MSRFFTLLAVAAIAGAMYVTAAPGGLRSAGPTSTQFNALKLRVAKLEKSVAQVKKLAVVEGVVLANCVMYHAQAVDDYGDDAGHTFGYSYADPQVNGGAPFLTTALDVAPSSEATSQFYFLGVNPACVSSINSPSTASTANTSGTLKRLSAIAAARGAH